MKKTSKKSNSKNSFQNVIEKKERYSFIKKYSEAELSEKKQKLSELLQGKFNEERTVLKSKENIKNIDKELDRCSSDIEDGGEGAYELCDVKIYRDKNKKEYYFEGELVGTEDAEEEDFQMEIDQDEN